jgi:hypothetical protein
VTRDERLDLIDRLKAANAEARERIRQREEERERNPHAMQELLLADSRITKDASDLVFTDPSDEPEPSPLVQKSADPDIVYRRYENNAQAASPEPPDWSGWETWLKGHLDLVREELIDATAEGMVKFFGDKQRAIDLALAALKGENADLKRMLADALVRLGQNEEKLKAVINDLNAERKDRVAMVGAYDRQVASCAARCPRFAGIGHDLRSPPDPPQRSIQGAA